MVVVAFAAAIVVSYRYHVAPFAQLRFDLIFGTESIYLLGKNLRVGVERSSIIVVAVGLGSGLGRTPANANI